MSRMYVVSLLLLSIVVIAILIGGCSGEKTTNDNTTAVPTANPEGPTLIPGVGDGYTIHGRVYLDGNIVAGAQVEAVSVDSTYRTSNTTDQNGVYHIILPAGAECNITAKYNRLQHTVWPVLVTEGGSSFNVYMTSTPKSVIRGTGYASGGPGRLNAGKINFSGFAILAVPANVNATISAAADNDGSFYMEVIPGVEYAMDMDIMPAVSFVFRNTDRHGMAKGTFGHVYDHSLNVTLRPDETALIDYEIFLP